MFRIFFIHLSVDRHLGCFRVLAIVPSAGMNIGVHVCFWIMAFLGYMSRHGATAGLIQLLWKTLWMFLQDLKIDQPYGPLLMKRKETLLWNSAERAFIFTMSLREQVFLQFSSFILYSNENHYFATCNGPRRERLENWDNFAWRQKTRGMIEVLKYHAENSRFHILKSCRNRKPGQG